MYGRRVKKEGARIITMDEKKVKELLKEVKKLKQENKKLKSRKKYGMVWEEEKEPEQVVLECKEKVPILKDVKDKEIKTDDKKPMNILIEGDNYHALQVLNYTHKSKIDVIYIDPPYNTGKKDEWKYNDKYVDKEDTYRHSKWLNMMAKRLKIAWQLLKREGVIFIAIDDNEKSQLKLLCDDLFDEKNFVGCICWKSRHSISNDLLISENHNYHLVYAKNFDVSFANRYDFRLPREHNGFKNPDNDPNGPWKPSPVDGPGGAAKGNPHYEFLGIKGYWRYSKKTMQELHDKGEIIKRKGSLQRKYYLKKAKEKGKSTTTWWDDVGTTTEGTKELINLFGEKVFNNPKPVSLIKRILELTTDGQGNEIILDFFAGSGTTGHAVLEMNEEDGGRRKFILCTNNENEICNEVTYPRVKKVIEGYDFEGNDKNKLYDLKLTAGKINQLDQIKNEIEMIKETNKEKYDKIESTIKNNSIILQGVNKIKSKKEGVGGNLKHYKTDFIDVGNLFNMPDEKKIELTHKAGEMIAIRENVFEEVEKNNWWQIFKSEDKTVAIYFREDQKRLEKLFEKLKKDNAIIYVFSWGKNELKGEEYGYDNIKIKDIPQPIVDVYKEINRL